ncbi:bacteriorhodopsin [Actinomycetospora flava]|uniref:Bacteriorhodopsin n=1 Tax=Actinomycetospora flava TaxID=3129232 RepID=A0ABU8M976_9PSEU
MFAAIGPLPAAPPENGGFSSVVSYTPGMYHLVEYSLGVAGLALFAGCVYSLMTRAEIGGKYRSAIHASALIQGIAFLAYVALFLSWHTGFVYSQGMYVPAPDARFSPGLRYADWSVTVPLLMVELLSVCALAGAALRRARFIAMASAFLMIITGFLGAQVFADGTSTTWLNVWGLISTVFFIVLYVVGARAILGARRQMSAEAWKPLMHSGVVLGAFFGAYPLLYLIQVYVSPDLSPATLAVWAVVVQVGFSFSDIAAKCGFGALVHKVAKVRTAEDVNAREESHPEQVWVSHVKQADAWPPQIAALSSTGVLDSLTGAPAGTAGQAVDGQTGNGHAPVGAGPQHGHR